MSGGSWPVDKEQIERARKREAQGGICVEKDSHCWHLTDAGAVCCDCGEEIETTTRERIFMLRVQLREHGRFFPENAEDQAREELPASACSPCPICGSNELDEDYTSLTTSKKGIDYQTGWIDCKSCGHEGPVINAVGPECDDISHRVREAWNSQANDQAIPPNERK